MPQNRQYTIEEIEAYAMLLRNLPCPVCNDTSSGLNGTLSHTVKSFILFTTSRAEPTVGCPDCLDKQNDNAILSTALLGWWGFPWGLIKTPVYIYRNIKAKKQNRSDYPNDVLLAYTLENIGEIETYKDDREKLKRIIQPKSF